MNEQTPVTGPKSPLGSDADIQSFGINDVVFPEGGMSDYAYLVLEGRVELTKTVEGTEIFLAEIGPGDLFGEMGLIDGNPRSATAMCLEPTKLQRFGKEDLMARLQGDSDFAAPVLSQLVSQLRETSNRLAHERVVSLQRAAEAAELSQPEKLTWSEKLRSFFEADRDLIDFQPDAVEIEQHQTPAIVKMTLYVILALMIGIFAWASFSSVDTAVSAQGRVTTEVPNILVQPSETAVVRTIRVKTGQLVEKGELLATLDATLAEADVKATRSSLVSVQAQEARLMVEASGEAPSGAFSDDLEANALQLDIYNQRKAALDGQLTSLNERIGELESEIASNALDAEDLAQQAEVLVEIEKMRADLMTEGHGSRMNYLSAKYQRINVDREMRSLEGMRERLEHQLGGLHAQRDAALADWQSKVAEELVAVRREREELAERLTKTRHRESLVNLVAPARGVILTIADRSVGSVIREAEPMFTIVPADVPMEMQVDVLPKDVGLIQVGDEVRVKLDALPFQKHGMMTGRVRLISEDAVSKEGQTAETVYRSRIELTDLQLRNVPESFRLTPGLTGSADILVGKRTIITYFIYPLMRAMDSSFREP